MRHPRRYRRIVLLCLFTLASVVSAGHAETSTSLEYRAKAAYIYHIAKFVQWPRDTFSAPDSPLTIAILRHGVLAGFFTYLEGKSVRGRPVRIREIDRVDDLNGCHILFISAGSKNLSRKIFKNIRDKQILSVGEVAGFAESGGVINFYAMGSKLRFEINTHAAKAAGLKISSELLRLGRIIDN